MRRRLFRLPARRPESIASDVDAEIRLHLDLRIAELVAGGMPREAAEREALLRFGPYDSARAELLAAARQRERRLTMLDHLDSIRHDLGYAARQIRRAPALAVAVTLTFALGIGANATMFGIVDRLLLRPPAHVSNPEELVQVSTVFRWEGEEHFNTSFSWPGFQDVRDNVPAFTRVAVETWPRPLSLGVGAGARAVNHMLVSGDYFRLMGTPIAVGRAILPEDNVLPDGQPVVVIGYGLWQSEFGGDREIVGRDITLANRRYTIVGVAPRGFFGVRANPVDVWIPIAAAEGLRFAGANWATARNSTWMSVFGRLAPGVTQEQATAQVTSAVRAGNELQRGRPDTTTQARLTSVLPGQQSKLSNESKVALLLGAVSVLVLLIACANVANLMLVRAVARRREIAVRLALGISRARLMRQLMVESALLAVIGGAAALLVVHWGSTVVQKALLSQYAWPDSPVDSRLLLFTLAATVAVGFLAGMAPALQGSALDLTSTLKEGARGTGLSRSRLRSGLLVLQASLAVVLLVGTGLFVRSLRNVSGIDVGLDLDRIVMGQIDLRSFGFDTASAVDYHRQAVERLRGLPQVENAVAAEATPFTGWSMGIGVKTASGDTLPKSIGSRVKHIVMPGYFATVGTRLVQGRDFTASEGTQGAEKVGIINESAARALWPNGSALGECVLINDGSAGCFRIVGIAKDTHRGNYTREESGLQLYLPFGAGTHNQQAMRLLVRPRGDPARALEPIRGAMQTVMPGLPHANVKLLREQVANEFRPWRLGATMFGVFGAIAIVLSALGLYSVIAYSVTQRTHEMGVRVALGAQDGDIRRLVLSQGLRLAAAGAALGVVAALAGGRFVESLLYEVSPRDPMVMSSVFALVLLVAIAACVAPARRATRANPLEALRAE